MTHSLQAALGEVDREFLRDVLAGLSREPKQLECKYFYDERGSRLFERITELPEYYLTRVEQTIMETHIEEMVAQIGPGVMLVEFGSGSSTKTRILLDQLEDAVAYVPLDISQEHLLKTADTLRGLYPDLEIIPLVADFTRKFELPESVSPRTHAAVYFPGSTIGNFTPDEVRETLASIAEILGPQGGLLIGIDLQKAPAVIEAAYNDSQGVTEEFNLNLLRRINRELGANFEIERFRHKAVYDEVEGRVEVFIVSRERQTVMISGSEFEFGAGEHILTEYSHKYTIEGFSSLAMEAGFSLHKSWTDHKGMFAVLHLVARSTESMHRLDGGLVQKAE